MHACIMHIADNNPCRSERDTTLLSSCDISSFSTTNAANGSTNAANGSTNLLSVVGSAIGCAVVVSLLFLVTLVVVALTLHRKHCRVNVNVEKGTCEVYTKSFVIQ